MLRLLLAIVAVQPAFETCRRCGAAYVRVDPAQLGQRAVEVACVVGGLVHGEVEQGSPGDVAGGGAHLVGVLLPVAGLRVPVAGWINSTLYRQAAAIGIAQAPVPVHRLVRAGLEQAVGDTPCLLRLAARNQRNARHRVVIDKRHLVQRALAGVGGAYGRVAGQQQRPAARKGAGQSGESRAAGFADGVRARGAADREGCGSHQQQDGHHPLHGSAR